ncbi:eukaryotic translation initiation factor 5-like [Dendronephthya gigantea]|uniref:eukaryotic translation initiation factor 5-like n=1 Tax=Dendronephthya gigantea TaxID=151771 RepID=UPI00106B5A98|nr:eukaryotic translation initiation factor 5-like [Dendronephthya gigantea]
MAMVNVNRKNTDQFYRYKMPKLLAKVEGKGNGIKTVIVNMVDIGKSLKRPPAYPTKFFGCELGAQTQIDLKNERYIVNGAHDGDKLQDILDDFIQKFVLCPECENPETLLHVEIKKERIGQTCIACGYSGVISLAHRLITFILKNPPGQEDTVTPSKKDKKNRRDKKGQSNAQSTQNGCTSPSHDSNEADVLPVVDTPTAHSDGFGDDDWSEDTSEAAVKKRELEGLSMRTKGLTMNEDLELTEQQRLQIFYSFVENKKKLNDFAAKAIVAEAERLEVMDKAVLVLAELLFTEDMANQISQHSVLFKKFLTSNQKAQKHLLGAFEMLVGKSFPEKLMPKIPRLLQLLYNKDFLEEEVLLEWAAKVSKKYVSKETSSQIHEKAAPFIKWLQEAEEESSEEEEENGEDLEVVYATDAGKKKILAEEKKKAEDDEDDLDIDEI